MRLILAAAVLVALPLSAQQPRDTTLAAGRRAYESADLAGAMRLLPVGLTRATPGDSIWAGGVHMLLDALLEQQQDSSADAWARWAQRLAPAMRVDSVLFPPRVARTLSQARTAVAGGVLDNSVPAALAWEPLSDPGSPRGQVRLARTSNVPFATIDRVGTMLPGESRALPSGTYTARLGGADPSSPNVTFEVLPGFVAVVTARPATAVSTRPTTPSSDTGATAVRGPRDAATGFTTCTAQSGGVVCWGDNRAGQLGGGASDTLPGMFVGERDLLSITLGGQHGCGLTRAGAAWCWGSNASGQLGTGTAGAVISAPVAVAGGRTFVQIVAGAAHTCALTVAGTAWCWGDNRFGQLGNRSEVTSATPAQVAAGTVTFASLTAGRAHTCGLTDSGNGWCWGANDEGQLGNGGTNRTLQPAQVQAPGPLGEIEAGGSFTCALARTGAAWCWGGNATGQLGDGSDAPLALRPVPVTGGLIFRAIAAGDAHACATTTDGASYCWGAGRAGQLGNGGTGDSRRPVLVVGGQTFESLALGQSHSCGFTALRIVWCWGDNARGQAGSLAGRGSPLPVPTLLRPEPLSLAVGTVPGMVREDFSDGNFTTGPSWLPDPLGPRPTMGTQEIIVARTGARGVIASAGVSTQVRIPVRREMSIEFDVRVDSAAARPGCGLNCGWWPAMVRLRVRNTDLTESEVWYVFGNGGGPSRTVGNVVIVSKADVTPGQWLRRQRFVIRDALPRAEVITQVSLGGVGTDFAARYDNIALPAGVPAAIAVRPDTLRLAPNGDTARVAASVQDSAGLALSWIPVSWSSSDTLVARVDATGLVTAGRPGRAQIRATAGALSARAIVTVRTTRGPAPRRATPPPASRP